MPYRILPTRRSEKRCVYTLSSRAGASGPRTSSFPRVLTSMMPTRSRTARHSSCGSVYQRGLRHGPRSTTRAPSASCLWWRGVRLTGMWDAPARAPRGTGWMGGLAVVAPISRAGRPVRRAAVSTSARWHILPWHGPIVTVLYLFSVWTSSNPSSTAWRTSDSVMSSQMQTKRRGPREGGATACLPVTRETASSSPRMRDGRRFGPPLAAAAPASLPWSRESDRSCAPVTRPGGVDALRQTGGSHQAPVDPSNRIRRRPSGAGRRRLRAGGDADEVAVEPALLAGWDARPRPWRRSPRRPSGDLP